MADIAAPAGVSRPSLYLVFPNNKEAVFRALAETARLIANAANGLKHADVNEATYVADVERFASLISTRIAAVSN